MDQAKCSYKRCFHVESELSTTKAMVFVGKFYYIYPVVQLTEYKSQTDELFLHTPLDIELHSEYRHKLITWPPVHGRHCLELDPGITSDYSFLHSDAFFDTCAWQARITIAGIGITSM